MIARALVPFAFALTIAAACQGKHGGGGPSSASSTGSAGGIGGAGSVDGGGGVAGGGIGGTSGVGGAADRKAISQSCNTDAQCRSGFCPLPDGVCCAEACDGPCQSCLASKTGKPNGTCAPIVAESDPDGECSPGWCDGYGSCCGADVEPPGGECPSVCNGGCSDGTCTITCSGVACNDSSLVCPPGFACRLSCEGAQACNAVALLCPETYACTVECDATLKSCDDLELMCSTGVCAIECQGSESCAGSIVKCGSNACRATCPQGFGNKKPFVACGPSCSCKPC